MSLSPPTATEIRAFRARHDLSQAALGEALGASKRTVEDWEGGRRLAPNMLRLALAAIEGKLEPWGLMEPTRGRIMRAGNN